MNELLDKIQERWEVDPGLVSPPGLVLMANEATFARLVDDYPRDAWTWTEVWTDFGVLTVRLAQEIPDGDAYLFKDIAHVTLEDA
jgi:hypothetical protein